MKQFTVRLYATKLSGMTIQDMNYTPEFNTLVECVREVELGAAVLSSCTPEVKILHQTPTHLIWQKPDGEIRQYMVFQNY